MKHNYPLVSIVTPAFNQAEFLDETIRSVLAQTYPNIEYIVIDDGSTDGTVEVLKRWGDSIRWETQPNMGQARTLNKGWSLATGSVIGYLSSDDLLDNDAVARLMDVYQGDSTVVFGKYRLIDQNGNVLKSKRTRFQGFADMVHSFNCPIGPGAIFSRSLLSKHGGWNPEFRQIPDFEFWLRIGANADFVAVPEPIASFRVHNGSQTFAVSNIAKADESINALRGFFAASLPNTKFNQKRALSAAFVFSACLHLRSGRFAMFLMRIRQAFIEGGVYTLAPANALRLLGTLVAQLRYRRIARAQE